MPEITRRSSTRLAPGWFTGMNGSSTVHCSSVSQNRSAIAASAHPKRRPERDHAVSAST
jgi:hypothetical protein